MPKPTDQDPFDFIDELDDVAPLPSQGGQSSMPSDMVGAGGGDRLAKVDLSKVVQSRSPKKGRSRKGGQTGEDQALKKDLVASAERLLSMAGTSIDEINKGDKKERKRGFGSVSATPVSNAGDKAYLSDDVTVVSHEAATTKFQARGLNEKLRLVPEKTESGAGSEDAEPTKLNKPKHHTPEQPKKVDLEVNSKVDQRLDPFDFDEESLVEESIIPEYKSIDSVDSPAPSRPVEQELKAADPLQMNAVYDRQPASSASSPAKKGFFHYFGIVALGLIAIGGLVYGAIFLTGVLGGDAPDIETLQAQAETRADEKREIITSKVTLQEDTAMVEEARIIAKSFLGADNQRFAYTFISEESKKRGLFPKYWKQLAPYKDELLKFKSAYDLPNETTRVAFDYGKAEEARQLVLYKVEDEPFRVDWSSFRELENVTLSEVVKEVKTIPNFIRAWVKPEHFYNAKYSDAYWQNYVAMDLEGNVLNCYVALYTESAAKLYSQIVNSPATYPKGGGADGAFVKILVRKPAVGVNYVEVLEVKEATWFPELEN